MRDMYRNTESPNPKRSHFVVRDIEFPEAREVRQPVKTSRRGSQLVTGEVELGQAGQVFQVFDLRYLWTTTIEEAAQSSVG